MKERNIGVDIAKIVAIFLVIMIHTCNQLTIDRTNLVLSWVASCFSSLTLSCIDLFAIATGYLCILSSCKYSRIVSLWVSAFFWGMIMLLFSDIVLGFHVPWKCYVNAAFPVLRGQYWFFTAYFMLSFFMPIMNKAVKNISKKEYDRLLIAMLIFMGVYSWLGGDLFRLHEGYSFVWLLSMYILGAYIRMYNPIKAKPAKCFLMALGFALVPCLRQLLSIVVGFRIPGDRFPLASYVSPFTIGVALFIFIGCLQLKVQNAKLVAAIKAIAATTFGVYLIHMQPFVWEHIWLPGMHKVVTENVPMYILASLVIPLIAFIIMVTVEHYRLKLFKWLGINKLISRIDDYLPR